MPNNVQQKEHTMLCCEHTDVFLNYALNFTNCQLMDIHYGPFQLRRSIFSIRARNLLEKETTINKILR